jgi:hypothetical protein
MQLENRYAPRELEAIESSGRLETTLIGHPQLKAGLSALRMHQGRSLTFGALGGRPGHVLLVTGEPGSGKSVLLETHETMFRTPPDEDGERFPVVRVEMPDRCTRKGLVEAILAKMGHTASEDWRTSRIVDEIARLADRHHVLAILIDEAHRIWGGDTDDVARFLVSMMNTVRAQLVLAGPPELGELDRRHGLERRREGDIDLRPYRWTNSVDQYEFRCMLGAFEARMQLDKPAGLDGFDIARRIFVASNGLIGLVSKIFVECLRLSILRQADVSVTLLAEAFDNFTRDAGRKDVEDISFDDDIEDIGLKDRRALWWVDSGQNPFLCKPTQLRPLWDSYRAAQEKVEKDARELRLLKIRGRAKRLERRATA